MGPAVVDPQAAAAVDPQAAAVPLCRLDGQVGRGLLLLVCGAAAVPGPWSTVV